MPKVTFDLLYGFSLAKRIEPYRDKTNKMACAPSDDSDQPGHPSSLIRVFTVRIKKSWVLSYPRSAQQRLWSDWADAHTHFVGFVMSWLKYWLDNTKRKQTLQLDIVPETPSCLSGCFAGPMWDSLTYNFCRLNGIPLIGQIYNSRWHECAELAGDRKYFSWANQSAERCDRLYTVFTLKLKKTYMVRWIDTYCVHVECTNSSSQIVWFDMRQVFMHGSKFLLHGSFAWCRFCF